MSRDTGRGGSWLWKSWRGERLSASRAAARSSWSRWTLLSAASSTPRWLTIRRSSHLAAEKGRRAMLSWPQSPAPHRLRRARVTSEREIVETLEPAAAVLGSPFTPSQIGQIARYLTLLTQWSKKARLTTITRPREAARLHILDSLLCLLVGIPPGASVLDVGSGAGLPGIPLKIARPDLRSDERLNLAGAPRPSSVAENCGSFRRSCRAGCGGPWWRLPKSSQVRPHTQGGRECP